MPQFDMKAHLQDTSNAHDSLTFAEFVERRRALSFIRLQKDGSGHNIEATKDEYSRRGPIRYSFVHLECQAETINNNWQKRECLTKCSHVTIV